MAFLFFFNSGSPISTIATINNPYSFDGRQIATIELGASNLTQTSTFFPTPIGVFSVIHAITQAGIAAVPSTYRVGTNRGSHTILREVQRLAEQAGLLFTAPVPIVLFFAPGDPLNPDRVWREEDYFSASVSSRRPSATGWITQHNDAWRDLTFYSPDIAAANEHGLILAHNTSIAPKPQSMDTDIVTDTNFPDKQASVNALFAILQAQNAAEAIRARETHQANVEVRWAAGTRYGIDFGLGDAIQLAGTPSTPRGLIVREVAIALDDSGRWSFQVGLGARSELAPALRGEYVQATQAPTFATRTSQ